jgi:hypothetical protein
MLKELVLDSPSANLGSILECPLRRQSQPQELLQAPRRGVGGSPQRGIAIDAERDLDLAS